MSRSVVSDSLRPHGLHGPWNSSGQNSGVGSHSLLQGIFPTQVSCTARGFFTVWATSKAWGSPNSEFLSSDRHLLYIQPLLGHSVTHVRLEGQGGPGQTGWASQVVLVVKNLPGNAGDIDKRVPPLRSERSSRGKNSTPLHVFLMEESHQLLPRKAWWATVHRVTKSQTWLSISAQHMKLAG